MHFRSFEHRRSRQDLGAKVLEALGLTARQTYCLDPSACHGGARGDRVVPLPEDRVCFARSSARRGIAVEPAMAAGRITADGCEGRLLSGQVFSADAAIGWLTRQLSSSRELGFPGLRIAVDMSWALRPVTGIEQLPQFEEGIAAALAGTMASVLCQYDRDRFDPVTLASVAAFHTRSVATPTYHADAVLRICRQYAPPGIRIAGEIDYKAEEPLALALAEAVRLDGDITVNMGALAFIDAFCSRMIAETAKMLAESRTVTLQCRPRSPPGSPGSASTACPASGW
jgi:hypothetical protein